MAEFVEVMEHRQRIHEYYRNGNGGCDKCPISSENNGTNKCCSDFLEIHPQEAKEIIMDWAKEHPMISNANKFYSVIEENFGKSIADEFIDIVKMPHGCYGFSCSDENCDKCSHRDFWQREWKNLKENENGEV